MIVGWIEADALAEAEYKLSGMDFLNGHMFGIHAYGGHLC